LRNFSTSIPNNLEVKALGVPMGIPWFQLKDLARQHGILAFSSNYALYGDMSNRIMRVLAQFASIQEFTPSTRVFWI
jgi:DNA polymerase V